MTRSRLPLLLAAGVLAPLTVLAGPAGGAAHAAPTPTEPPSSTAETTAPGPDGTGSGSGSGSEEQDGPPLEVRLESMRPAVVPRRGPLRVTGTVTNRTGSTWTDLQTYLAVSTVPLTSPEELDAAQAEPAGQETGFGRLVDPGLYADLPDLGPGDSADFRLVVPRDRLGLPDTPGVYRIGVHALGTEEGEGRLDGADGRARTFLAQMPAPTRRGRDRAPQVPPTRLALVMQLRNHVVRSPTGELRFVKGWRETLGPDGRLGRLLGLSDTTAGFPLSWVLDPAVVEAAGTVAEGNPGTDLGGRAYDGVDDVTGGGAVGQPSPGQDGSVPPTQEGTPAGGQGTGDSGGPGDSGDSDATSAEGAADAAAWLDGLRSQAARHPTFAVPYGDLDVAAAARAEDEQVIDRALRTGVDTLTRYTISSRALVAPLNGALNGWMIDRVPRRVPVLLSDDAVPGSDAVLAQRGERPLVLFSPDTLRPDADAAAAAGLDRTDATALGMRQRILAETAVRSLRGQTRPLVALLPPSWDPGPEWESSAFFAGLDAPWIQATGLGDLAAQAGAGGPQATDEEFRYLRAQRRAEVPVRIVDHVREVTRSAGLLDDTLVDDDTTGPRLARQALLSASFYARRHPRPAAQRLSGIEDLIDSWLRRIRIAAPPFVISSSEQGSFLVPVTNGLDQRVRVALGARVTGTGLEVTAPGPAELPPGTRRPFRMEIRSTAVGVHRVALDLVTGDGERLYAGPQVPVRTSRVGLVVWVVMGIAAAVFLAAIVVRVVRRVRRRRRTHGPVLRSAS